LEKRREAQSVRRITGRTESVRDELEGGEKVLKETRVRELGAMQ
jgi:hypothetical protein